MSKFQELCNGFIESEKKHLRDIYLEQQVLVESTIANLLEIFRNKIANKEFKHYNVQYEYLTLDLQFDSEIYIQLKQNNKNYILTEFLKRVNKEYSYLDIYVHHDGKGKIYINLYKPIEEIVPNILVNYGPYLLISAGLILLIRGITKI